MGRMGWTAALGCAAALAVAGCATEPGAFDGAFAALTVHDENTRVALVFSDADRQAIRAYFAPAAKGRHGKHGHNPHGDFQALPPGLQKQVRRNGHLPPGLARQRLPDDLERRLSPLPDGYVRVRVGTDIVLMDARTEIVLDLIRELG